MRKVKKTMAFALAASMAVSSSIAALAADNTGTVQGTGVVEGHVEKELLNVVLPTVSAGSSAFAYTMDPERLIQGTDATKYEEGTVFPEKDKDTGVYFLVADKTYANTSNTYQVINKSSCNVTLTVDVQATQNTAKDITLAGSETVSTSDPELYLGLNVGDTKQAISTTKATVTKTIAGVPGNFNIVVVEESDGTKKYAYQEKEDASTWKAMNINMSGTVSQLDIETDTTAPTVDVTWSWEKAADTATADSDVVEYVVGPQISMDNNGLITMTDFTSTQNYASLKVTDGEGTKWDISDSPFTWDLTNYDAATGGDANIQLSEQWKNFLIEKGGNVTLELTLSDGTVRTLTTTIS